jgi:hypothetical protein
MNASGRTNSTNKFKQEKEKERQMNETVERVRTLERLHVTPGIEAANPVAATTTVVTETLMPPVVPPVQDDLALSEEVKKQRRTHTAA